MLPRVQITPLEHEKEMTAPRLTSIPTSPVPGNDATSLRGAVTFKDLDNLQHKIVLAGIRLGAMYSGNLCRCNREGLLPGEKLCPKCRGKE